MDFHLKFTNLQPDEAVKKYLRDKIGSLEKLLKPIEAGKSEMGPRVHAWVEVARTTAHHQEGKIWYAECQLRLPGKSLRSTATSDNLLAAIDEAKEELYLIIKKQKEKHKNQIRRQQ